MPEGVVVFVSHAESDKWIAEKICEDVEKAGAAHFLDVVDAEIGDDFDDRIRDGLQRCTELLVLLTPASEDRRWVWMEIGGAWALKKRVVVVLHGLTIDEILGDPDIPIVVKRKNLVVLNEFPKYVRQLRRRVRES